MMFANLFATVALAEQTGEPNHSSAAETRETGVASTEGVESVNEVTVTISLEQEAGNAPTAQSTGAGTPDDPAVTETTQTTTESGPSGEVITTTVTDAEWFGVSPEGEPPPGILVEGQEHSESEETVSQKGELVHAEKKRGGQTTIATTAAETETEIQTENGVGQTGVGEPDVHTEVPDVTVTLTPGGEETQREDAAAWFNEDTLGLPSWVRPTGEAGPEWLTGGSSSEDSGVITNILVETHEHDTTYTRIISLPDGTVTTEIVTCRRDNQGRITAYSIQKTRTESTSVTTTLHSEPPPQAAIHADGGWTELEYEPPQPPAVRPDPELDAQGNIYNGEMLMEIRNESSNLVGYTVATIENGVPVRYSNPVLGRYTAVTTYVETLENGLKKLTSTKTTVVRMESGSVSGGYRTVTGWMGQVEDSSSFDPGTLTTFLPGVANAGDGTIILNKDLYNRPYILKEYNASLEQHFQWLGEYGLESAIRIKADDVDTWQPHQFVLQGADGQKYYVYCSDFEVSPAAGAPYNMQRLEDADFIEHEDKLRAIALNGYWGVANTGSDPSTPSTGSLDAFRQMLVEANIVTLEQSAQITDGMALAATQAAIWYYANSGSTRLSPDDVVGKYYQGGSLFSVTEAGKKEIVNRIYQYLIGMDGQKADAGNTLLTKDDFAKEIRLTVHEKETGTEKYNTDIGVTMTIIPDNTTSSLVVYVMAGAEQVAAFRLCGDASGDDQKQIGKAVYNGDGSYTLKGVKLASGISVTLNLTGTQNLQNGVYLFHCDVSDIFPNGSQTFIGAGSASQAVDLSIHFGFTVADPVVTFVSSDTHVEMEEICWSAYYFTYSEDEKEKYGDVPKTGDHSPIGQITLATGAVLSLAAAFFFRRKEELV